MIGHVGDDANCRVGSVGVDDLVDNSLHARFAEVDNRHARAFVGEQVRRSAPHARCGAGDNHTLARD